MTEDCIFCRISNREIDADIVYEDDRVLAFKDIDPEAPVHVLVIPRQHIPSLLDADDPELLGHIMDVARKLAGELGIAEDGFRVVINAGKHGCQSVPHLHLHLLGGRQMHWPPG